MPNVPQHRRHPVANEGVAFAGILFQSIRVEQRNPPTPGSYDAAILQGLYGTRNRRPVCTQHKAQQFVRHRQRIGLRAIVHIQKPPRETLIDAVQTVAERGLRYRRQVQVRIPEHASRGIRIAPPDICTMT